MQCHCLGEIPVLTYDSFSTFFNKKLNILNFGNSGLSNNLLQANHCADLTMCFECRNQELTKNLFDLTPLFLKSPLLTTVITSSPRNLPPRSIGRSDDQSTCLKGSDA